VADLLRLGLACNEECLYCPVVDEKNKFELSTDDAKKKIAHLAGGGCRCLTFTGGEPTLRKDLAELIGFAKEKQISYIEIHTNGILLADTAYVRRLARAGLDCAIVSLNSSDKETSEYLTHTNDSFERTVCGIGNILSEGMRAVVAVVVTSRNCAGLPELMGFTREKFGEPVPFCINFLRPNPRAVRNGLAISLEAAKPHLEAAFSILHKSKVPFLVEGIPICYMKGYERYNNERPKKAVRFIDKVVDITNLDAYLNSGLKAKGAQCANCHSGSSCAGVWTEYARIFGTSGLAPISPACTGTRS